MPYNEGIADRIRKALSGKGVKFSEKKMFSGICFMVKGKMCCGIHTDKKSGKEFLLCRIGEAEQKKALGNEYVLPMNFTGRTMKDYIFVTEEGFKKTKELVRWIQLCLDYNPIAKKSKKNTKTG